MFDNDAEFLLESPVEQVDAWTPTGGCGLEGGLDDGEVCVKQIGQFLEMSKMVLNR